MNNKKVIEVNGKHYDIISGSVLSADVVSTPIRSTAATTIHTRMQPTIKKPVMDMVRPGTTKTMPALATTAEPLKPRPPRPLSAVSRASAIQAAHVHHKVAVVSPTPMPHLRTTVSTPKPNKATHAIAIHTARHKQQNAVTLMRRAVTKPAPGFKKQIHVQAALANATPSLIVKKTSVNSITTDRLLRAQAVDRSQQISRFQHAQAHHIAVGITPIPVQPEPTGPTEAGAPSPAPTNKPATDMFERAIANASHFVDIKAQKKHFSKKRKQQIASLSASALALAVIGGFALYQNMPGIQFKVASFQAGVTTTMPNLQSTGFAYKGISSQFGKITLGLSDGASTHQLTQQTTNWSSTDLLRQAQIGTTESGEPNYQKLEAGNTEVFRFSDTTATWIKDGILYQLSGQTPVDDVQVKTLAQNS